MYTRCLLAFVCYGVSLLDVDVIHQGGHPVSDVRVAESETRLTSCNKTR